MKTISYEDSVTPFDWAARFRQSSSMMAAAEYSRQYTVEQSLYLLR